MWNYHRVTHCSLLVLFVMLSAAGVLTAQQPFVRFGWPADEESDTLHWHPGADVLLRVFAGPAGVRLSSPQNVKINPAYDIAGEFIVPLLDPQPGINHLCITATSGGESVSKCLVVVVEEPVLREGIDQWRGVHAIVGRMYNPSSDWRSTNIPIDHYVTVVLFDGHPVFSGAGTSFDVDKSGWELVVDEYTQQIETVVYWKPGGTDHDDEWVRIYSSPASRRSVLPVGEGRFEIRYAAPEHVEGFEFEWVLDSSLSPVELEPIVLRQRIAPKRFIVPLPMEASCGECASYGIRAQILPGLDSSRLRLEVVDSSKAARVPNGKRLDVEITMKGRGGSVGSGRVGVTIKVPRAVASNSNQHEGTSLTTSDSGGMRWADFDRAGTAAIRALPQFAGRTVNIYAIEGDALQGVITSIQAADSADYYVLNTLGAEIIGVPWPNIATVVVLIARRWGPSYDKFENSLNNYLQSDSEDPPVELFQQIYRLAHTILERESMRPTRFYLVTTSDRQPKALALLGTKRDDAGNTMVVPTTEAGSMRAIFDAIAKKWFGRLQQSLAVQSSPRETARDALLRQVWPEVPQER